MSVNYLSEKQLAILHGFGDATGKTTLSKWKRPVSKIIEHLKNELEFEEVGKTNEKLAYLYYELEHIYAVLGKKVKSVYTIKEELDISETELKLHAVWGIKFEDDSIIKLYIVQDFVNVNLVASKKDESRIELSLPLFMVNKLKVYLLQNGVKQEVLEKNFDIKETKLTSYYLNAIFDRFAFKVEKQPVYTGDIKIYHDNELLLEKDNALINVEIQNFFKNEMVNGSNLENFTFRKTVAKAKEVCNHLSKIHFTINEKDEGVTYNVRGEFGRKVTCELTNDSGYKVVISQVFTDFEDGIMSVNRIIEEIFKKGGYTVFVEPEYDSFKTCSWLTEGYEDFESTKINKICDLINFHSIEISVKNINGMFLPEIPNKFKDKEEYRKCILAEILEENEKGDIYLYQYSYWTSFELSAFNFKQRTIIRAVYKMENAIFNSGISKLENVVFPNFVKEKSYILYLDDDFEASDFTEDNLLFTDKVRIKTSKVSLVKSAFSKANNDSNISSYEIICDFDMLSKAEEVTLFEKRIVNSDITLVKEGYTALSQSQKEALKNILVKVK